MKPSPALRTPLAPGTRHLRLENTHERSALKSGSASPNSVQTSLAIRLSPEATGANANPTTRHENPTGTISLGSNLLPLLFLLGCGGSSTGSPRPPDSNQLTLSLTGSGKGIVTSVPGGINCGPTCLASFGSGTTVQLIAAPDPGSTFTGWTGACSGTGACQVDMNSVESVAAGFGLGGATLTVAETGTGIGIVTSSPNGINCGTTCTGGFSLGTVVQLSAVANTGSAFAGWTGPCSGTDHAS